MKGYLLSFFLISFTYSLQLASILKTQSSLVWSRQSRPVRRSINQEMYDELFFQYIPGTAW